MNNWVIQNTVPQYTVPLGCGLWSFRTWYHRTRYHWTVVLQNTVPLGCGADDLTDVKAGAPTQVFLMERLIGDQCVGAHTVFD